MHPVAPQRTFIPARPARLMAGIVAFTLLLTAVAVAPVAATARGDGLRDAANAHRVAGGLDPVVGTVLLDDIADARAAQMATADQLEHDLAYVGDRLDRAGVCHGTIGEIIAWESGYYADYSYDRTMNLWWNSAGHHAIIMTAAYNAAGGSWATAADGGHYSVMVFVELCSTPSATASTTLQPAHPYSPDRPMVFRPGSFTGFRLSSDGAVLSQKVVSFDSRTRATAAGRARVNGHAYLEVSSGPFSGWWVRETPRSFVRGMTGRRSFKPARRIGFEAGTYTGRTFDKLGRVTGSKTATLEAPSGASASARAIINGRPFYRVKDGLWAGYWIRDDKRVNPA
jgi:uncharacterized protein YkwD